MNLLLIQFIVSYAYVLLRGLQTQNVVGGNYIPAFLLCYLLAALEIVGITLIVKSGWASFLPVGTGSSLGIISSMYIYRRLG